MTNATETSSQTPSVPPLGTARRLHPPVPTPAGDLLTLGNASPEVAAILQRRLPLEQMVRGCRAILSHEERRQTDARYIAQARSDLTEAVNALAVFDLEHLTQECRDRLTAFGVPFTYSTETLRAAAE